MEERIKKSTVDLMLLQQWGRTIPLWVIHLNPVGFSHEGPQS